jgi:hypothetical protein
MVTSTAWMWVICSAKMQIVLNPTTTSAVHPRGAAAPTSAHRGIYTVEQLMLQIVKASFATMLTEMIVVSLMHGAIHSSLSLRSIY